MKWRIDKYTGCNERMVAHLTHYAEYLESCAECPARKYCRENFPEREEVIEENRTVCGRRLYQMLDAMRKESEEW